MRICVVRGRSGAACAGLSAVLLAMMLLATELLIPADCRAQSRRGAAEFPEPPPPAQGPLYTLDQVREIVREELAAQEALRGYSAAPQPPTPLTETGLSPSAGSELTMYATWRNGLELETANQEFRVHVGGRTQFDGVWFDPDTAVESGGGGTGEFHDALNFRRARFRIDGKMYEVVEWAAEYDFVNQANVEPISPPSNGTSVNVPALTDLWVGLTQLPIVGNLRIGNFKEPIGLEHLTSSRWLDFMERSFLQDAFFGPFNNGFSPGMMLFNWGPEERATWAIGGFKNSSNIFGNAVGDGEYAVTGRATYLPWYEEDGRYLMHVGIAGSHRDLDEGAVRVRSRASLRSGNPGPFNPALADSGLLLGESQDLIAAEAALVVGPWHLQSEYVASYIQDASSGGIGRGAVMYQGWYGEVLYFLTGEHRPYNRRAGVFDRIVPYENYLLTPCPHGYASRGLGAWQVGARYSMLDLRDNGLDGGVLQDVTLGLNWFLNPNLKMQWNYVYLLRDAAGTSSDGEVHGAGMRVAYDF